MRNLLVAIVILCSGCGTSSEYVTRYGKTYKVTYEDVGKLKNGMVKWDRKEVEVME